jgi:ABC-type multidrug transport system fused ATPase/permease subunit
MIEVKKNEQYLSSLIRRTWSLINNKRKKQIILVFLLMLLASFAEVVSIGAVFPLLSVLMNPTQLFNNEIFKPLFNYLNISKPSELIIPIASIFSILTLISAFIRLLLMWAQFNFGASVSIDFSIETFTHSLNQPYSYHISKNTSEIQSGISKANELGVWLITPLLTLFSSFIVLLIVLFALITLNPKMVLFSILGFSFIYISITQITKKRVSIDSKNMNIESVKMIKSIQEGLGGIRDVIVNGTHGYFESIYRNAITPFRKSWVNINIVGSAPRFLVEAVGMIFIAVIATIIAIKENSIQSSLAIVGALAIGAQRMLPIMQLMFSSFISLKGNYASISEVLTMLEKIPKNNKIENHNPILFKNTIELNNLSFKYNNDGPWVLQNINININKGEKVGFIGITGSGKSTILDILMCLLTPTIGQMKIDTVDINENNIKSWQKHLAHVPQSIYLSDTSIYENIAFGIPYNLIDKSKVIEAASKAQISNTIDLLDHKYDTIVGERGIKLSGGQRQRIGIARALYKNADVIIFDEATSALDNITENEVMESINNLEKNLTIIIVAHRLTTLKNCDKIFEFTNSGIIIHDSYQKLCEQLNNSRN